MKCILCNTTTTPFPHPQRGVYHSCPNCELIYKDPSFHPTVEDEYKEYTMHENFVGDPRYCAFFKRFLDYAVFPFVGEGKKALDFGSGPEPVLATFLETSYNYDVDIYDLFFSPKKVYEGKKYDLITCTEVVEHLNNPLPFFKLFSSLLSPGGVLSIMTLLHPRDKEEFLSWYYIREDSHITFYSLKTLQYIASQTGLTLIYSDEVRYASFKKEF